MSCTTINKSRLLNCKNGFSGIKAIGFLPFVSGGLTLSSDDVFEGTGLTGSVYQFQLKNDGNIYSEDILSDRQTGTTVYSGTGTFILPILDRATRDQVKLLALGSPHIFLELYDGKILLMGSEFGAELSGGTIATGGAKSDLSGYTLTFTSEEKRPIVFLGLTASTSYKNAIELDGAINPE